MYMLRWVNQHAIHNCKSRWQRGCVGCSHVCCMCSLATAQFTGSWVISQKGFQFLYWLRCALKQWCALLGKLTFAAMLHVFASQYAVQYRHKLISILLESSLQIYNFVYSSDRNWLPVLIIQIPLLAEVRSETMMCTTWESHVCCMHVFASHCVVHHLYDLVTSQISFYTSRI